MWTIVLYGTWQVGLQTLPFGGITYPLSHAECIWGKLKILKIFAKVLRNVNLVGNLSLLERATESNVLK